MNVLALAEAWWAQHSIHLDQEPGGDRSAPPSSSKGYAGGTIAHGGHSDSMIAGCGVVISA